MGVITMKLKTIINIKDVPKHVEEDIEKYSDQYAEIDRQVKQEIKDYIDQNDLYLTEKQIKKSKFPNDTCSICGQMGCDTKLSYKGITQKYHKKCLKMFKKKVFYQALKNKNMPIPKDDINEKK